LKESRDKENAGLQDVTRIGLNVIKYFFKQLLIREISVSKYHDTNFNKILLNLEKPKQTTTSQKTFSPHTSYLLSHSPNSQKNFGRTQTRGSLTEGDGSVQLTS
jgi:hypothetical protein